MSPARSPLPNCPVGTGPGLVGVDPRWPWVRGYCPGSTMSAHRVRAASSVVVHAVRQRAWRNWQTRGLGPGPRKGWEFRVSPPAQVFRDGDFAAKTTFLPELGKTVDTVR